MIEWIAFLPTFQSETVKYMTMIGIDKNSEYDLLLIWVFKRVLYDFPISRVFNKH